MASASINLILFPRALTESVREYPKVSKSSPSYYPKSCCLSLLRILLGSPLAYFFPSLQTTKRWKLYLDRSTNTPEPGCPAASQARRSSIEVHRECQRTRWYMKLSGTTSRKISTRIYHDTRPTPIMPTCTLHTQRFPNASFDTTSATWKSPIAMESTFLRSASHASWEVT